MTAFEIITSALLDAGVDPSSETWGLQSSDGLWSAFCLNIHSGVGDSPEAAAEAFAAEKIKTCSVWREWSDDEGDREGFSRKYKGLRVRAIRGDKVEATDDDRRDRWNWDLRYYGWKDDEASILLASQDAIGKTEDESKLIATGTCSNVIQAIHTDQQERAVLRKIELQKKADAAQTAKENGNV